MSVLDTLARARFILLTTFRRDGTPVATPVAHAVADGIVYTSTGADTGKVKRLRRDARVTVAACDLRGRTTGPAIEAVGRVLTGPEAERAIRLKEARNVLSRTRRMYEVHLRGHTFVGIAIHPADVPSTRPSRSEQPMAGTTTQPESPTGRHTGDPSPAPPGRELRSRIRLAAGTLAVAATTVAALLIWLPWPGRNNLTYADLRAAREASWAGAMIDTVATGAAAVMLGLTVCALARGRGAAWARIGALATALGGIVSAAGLAAMGLLVWYATDTNALPAELGAAFLAYVEAETTPVAVLLVPGVLVFTLGVLALAVALWRARTTPRWVSVALILLSLGVFVVPSGRAQDVTQAAQYLLFAATAVWAWRSVGRGRTAGI